MSAGSGRDRRDGTARVVDRIQSSQRWVRYRTYGPIPSEPWSPVAGRYWRRQPAAGVARTSSVLGTAASRQALVIPRVPPGEGRLEAVPSDDLVPLPLLGCVGG